jgi:hypothetical protein
VGHREFNEVHETRANGELRSQNSTRPVFSIGWIRGRAISAPPFPVVPSPPSRSGDPRASHALLTRFALSASATCLINGFFFVRAMHRAMKVQGLALSDTSPFFSVPVRSYRRSARSN